MYDSPGGAVLGGGIVVGGGTVGALAVTGTSFVLYCVLAFALLIAGLLLTRWASVELEDHRAPTTVGDPR